MKKTGHQYDWQAGFPGRHQGFGPGVVGAIPHSAGSITHGDQIAGAFSTRRDTTQLLVFDSGRLSVISTTSPSLNSLFSS